MQASPGKIRELVAVLRGIGVGRKSPTRAVVFSERIRTLEWIAAAIREELGMTDAQVQTFQNSRPGDKPQQIIEDFSMASKQIRVFVASDIAAEGPICTAVPSPHPRGSSVVVDHARTAERPNRSLRSAAPTADPLPRVRAALRADAGLVAAMLDDAFLGMVHLWYSRVDGGSGASARTR
jgi:hypothetical protein